MFKMAKKITETRHCNTYKPNMVGEQFWTCGEKDGHVIFTTPFPVRTDCIEDWINDIEDDVTCKKIFSFHTKI